MSKTLPIVFAVYPLLLSGIPLVWLLITRHRSRTKWGIQVLACAAIITFAFMTSPWAFTSYYLRYVFLGLFVLTAIVSYLRLKTDGAHSPAHDNSFSVPTLLAILLFVMLDSLVVMSYSPAGKLSDVTFPLRSGTYYVLQGGASIFTNPFHALGSNKLAIDFVKLNSFGNRADGIAPGALAAYQSFGERIYSPCRGRVLRIRDNMPDRPPGNPDTEHPEGNHLVLRCPAGDILMAHLRRGSITVKPGDVVTAGEPLAEIGNSGNTLEPHLHMEAAKDGEAVWLGFDGRSLSVNSLIKRE